MDPRREGRVEFFQTIRGEEEDPGLVFEQAEEDGHKGVALHVVASAFGEEAVGFVEEKDGVPFAGKVENALEGALRVRGFRPQLASTNVIERSATEIGNAFWNCFFLSVMLGKSHI